MINSAWFMAASPCQLQRAKPATMSLGPVTLIHVLHKFVADLDTWPQRRVNIATKFH